MQASVQPKEMSLFNDWCKIDQDEEEQKRLWRLTEKNGGRETVRAKLREAVRLHYDSFDRIADDAESLGYKFASAILRERLPRTARARSGEMGEIIASELVEEKLGFRVPVRRLRYKDGREMALRGDDFIGVVYAKSQGGLRLLKGESKSRAVLAKTAITEARAVLDRDHGRCTAISLLFVADRLLDRTGADRELGRAIRAEVGTKSLRPHRIDHLLFTLSGNAPRASLKANLDACDKRRGQTVINMRIDDHQDFIAEIYNEAGNVGDD
ncbi:MAG TPA: Hachiman antiphage defense system protein HamA [Bryobacteraceae bacterium]|jgi:hypothetical protein